MANLVNQEISNESAQTPVDFVALTPESARTVFTAASKPWSGVVITAGVEPYVVAPYGLMTGGAVTPGAAAGDVASEALTAMMPGVSGADAVTGVLTVAAKTDLTITLNTVIGTPFRIDSVTVSDAGAIALVVGTPHASAFNEVRGSAGGPPSVPLGAIEIAQVRRNYAHAADQRAVTTAEIFQVPGTHQERYDYPVWNTDPINGTITFVSALSLIHGATAGAASTAGKKVYARYATPLYAPISRVKDWVPAETSNSTNSEAFYDNITVGSFTSSLGQATFTAALNDGVTDALLAKVGQNLLFRFKPDKNRAANIVTQGILGVARTFGVGAAPSAAFTISPTQASVNNAA
jgi:hypothetical protein